MQQLNEIFTWATGLIDSLTQLVTDSPITYLIIFALTAVDVLLPIVPAEATVTASAVLAGQGTLNIAWVMIAAGLGAFIGDNIAYWLGRAAGRPVVRRILRGDTSQLDRVEEQFDRRGGLFIVVGRFIPGGRTVVAIGAGVLQFSWLQFLVYDALAATIWAFQAAIPGFIGGSLASDKPWLAMIFGFVLSGTLALGIALTQRWWESRHSARPDVARAADSLEDESSAVEDQPPHALRREVVSRVTGIPITRPGDATAGDDADALGTSAPEAD
jgi:membrane protein DedA with SNARE-associated domain